MRALRICLPVTTLGDVYTVVLYPPMSSHRGLSPEDRAAMGIGDGLVRLSAGIEDSADLIDDLDQAKPVLRSFEGWSEELGRARAIGDLPAAARNYLRFIEDEAGAPLVLVSVGSRRDETIVLRDPFAR